MKLFDTKPIRVSLLTMILFILVVMSEIPRIYFFSELNWLLQIFDLIQFPIYIGLIYLIYLKRYDTRQLVVFFIIGVLLLIGYVKSANAVYFRSFLLILAAKDFSYKSILKTCRYAITSVFLLSIILWFFGISDSGIGRRGRIALGYVHPNIVAQVIMIIALLWVAEKSEKLNSKNYFILECIAIGVYIITGSKNATIILAITPVFIEIIKKIIFSKKENKLIKIIFKCSQVLLVIFTVLSAKFLPQSGLLQRLDLIFTNRLFLNYYLLNKFGISLFGQNVVLQDNSGTVYNDIRDTWGAIITCDCSYVNSLILMGLIPTVICLIVYIFIMKKAIDSRNYMIIAVALLLALYAFCESQLVDIYNNFVYFYILAFYEFYQRENILGKDVKDNDT